MNLTFGAALKEKGIQLRYPVDHQYVNGLYKQYPEKFPLPFVGCDDSQIEEIMAKQHAAKLPKIYIEFLSHMGMRCGDLFLGYDVTHRYLTGYSFSKSINEIIAQNNHQPLDRKFFGFWSQQSHTFAFFYIDDGDDPVVYTYGELGGYPEEPHRNGPIKFLDHLSEFLTEFIKERESSEAQEKFLEKYASQYR